jgi:hypothetical protein
LDVLQLAFPQINPLREDPMNALERTLRRIESRIDGKPGLTTFAIAGTTVAVTTLAVLIAAAVPGMGAEIREVRKTVEFQPGGSLNLKIDVCSLNLSSWDRNQVDVYARIEPPTNTNDEYARLAVEATRIEIEATSHSLTVATNFDGVPSRTFPGGRSLPHVRLEIKAPRNLHLRLDADRSEVEIHGAEGRLNLETDRTNLSADDLAGELRLKMDRGKADISGFRGSIDAETDRTDVSLGAQITGNSRLEAQRGNMAVRVPGSQGLSVRADVGRRKEFKTDLPLTLQNMSSDLLEGALNGGGPELIIRTDRGKVTLTRAR